MFLKFLFDTEMHSFYYVLCSGKIYIFTENVYPKITLREKGYWEGACGTGKQQEPGQCPGEFHGCKADRKLLREKKGIGRGLAELENSKSPDNAPENFMAAKQTGNCSARKRVLGGGLRNWNRRIHMSKEKSSVKSLLLGKWNTKTIVGVAIGAALFGVLMVFGGIKVATNTSLSSAMVVVVVVGALFGPLPAALAAGLGNVIADLISGYGFWFDWSIGNAVLGFFVGLLPLYGARIEDGVFQVKHAIIYTILCIIGNALAFGVVTPIFTVLFFSSELTITWIQAFSAIISNASILVIVGIPVLLVLAKRNARATNLSKED